VGTLTWLPSQGQAIGQGQVQYRVANGDPVVLLYGSAPAWRTLDEGLTGADVTQLNHDLVMLGYASSSYVSTLGWDYFSWETAHGVQQMESALGGSSPPGSLPLGLAVFEPGAIRVTNVLGSLGGPEAGPVLAATSDQRVVTISHLAGVGGGGGDAVTVTLTHPSVAGTLDRAQVTVDITTASISNALAVPEGALLAQSSGGYAVELTGAGNSRWLAPVTVGIFDDDSGMVQVTGALTPGEQVVVPTT
jgi:hypothetical protein